MNKNHLIAAYTALVFLSGVVIALAAYKATERRVAPLNVSFTFNMAIPAKNVSEMTNAALDAMAKKGALPTFKETK